MKKIKLSLVNPLYLILVTIGLMSLVSCGGGGSSGQVAERNFCPTRLASQLVPLATGDTPPRAYYQSLTTVEDTGLSISLSACDPDTSSSSGLSWTITSGPLSGTLSTTSSTYPDAVITYTPNASYTGSDYFYFTVSDGTNTSNTAEIEIAVTPAPVTLSSLAINAPSTVDEGTTGTCTATATYSDASTLDVSSSASWSVSPSSYATMSSSGVITGTSVASDQQVTITALYTYNSASRSDTATVTIVDTSVTLSGVVITTSSSSVDEGSTLQFTATAQYSDSSTLDVTSSSAWAVTPSSYGTITTGGVLTGLPVAGDQTVLVSGDYGGFSDTFTVTVVDTAILSSVVITAPSSVNEGSSVLCTATAHYSDSATLDVTSSASWAVTPSSYGTITSGGILTGLPVLVDQSVVVSAVYGAYSDTHTATVANTNLFGNPWYVDINATSPTEDGGSWGTAFSHPSSATAVASSGDIIYVAAGTYAPLSTADPAVPVLDMIPGVEVYGGWEGDVLEAGETAGYNPAVNITTLTGDANNDQTGDIYNVVHGASNALLDGFAIKYGNANGSAWVAAYSGGGMFNYNVIDLTVRNCVFSSNTAAYYGTALIYSPIGHGGGMNNEVSQVVVTGSTFTGNSSVSGGGLSSWKPNVSNYTSLLLDNCTFNNNAVLGTNVNAYLPYGGGVKAYRVSDVTVRDTTFSGNSAYTYGGGMWAGGADANSTFLVDDNTTFFNNTTVHPGVGRGGGLYVGVNNARVINSIFNSNSSDLYGGGIEMSATDPIISGSTFYNNIVTGGGGGVHFTGVGTLNIDNTIFNSNEAANGGGGLYSMNSSVTIDESEFTNNLASNSGGGGIFFYVMGGGSFTGTLTVDKTAFRYNQGPSANGGGLNFYGGNQVTNTTRVTNSTFYRNTSSAGGGMVHQSGGFAEIINNTFSENSATLGASYYNASATASTIINCIFWGDTTLAGAPTDGIYGPVDVTYSDLEVPIAGTGNINSNPAFASTPDLPLSSSSAAIDAGTDTSGYGVATDKGDTARPQGSAYDMGAWEF